MVFRAIFVTFVLLVGVVVTVPDAHAAQPGDVVINELQWMGSSANSADEWIELRNATGQPVDLSGWTLFKKSGGDTVPMLTLPAGATIAASGYFLIANFPETDVRSMLAVTPDLVDASVSLVNSALQVTLADASGATIDVADDGSGTPLAGKYVSGQTWQSMERNRIPGDGALKESWHTASASANLKLGPDLGTPRAANSNLPPALPTLASRTATVGEVVTFDASEASDPDGDPLTFQWAFGDGASAYSVTPTHAYAAAGTFLVDVIASDGAATAAAQGKVLVSQPALPPTTSAQSPPPVPATPPKSPPDPLPMQSQPSQALPADGLFLNEFFPDPTGRDDGSEFIEVVNRATASRSTSGWQVKIGTRIVPLPAATLETGGFVLLRGDALSVTLRNGGAEVYLMDPAGTIRHGVAYPSARVGRSFSWTGRRWAWADPTPGAVNASVTADTAQAAKPTTVSVAEAREAEAGRDVVVRGVVVVPTGVLGPRQFLLADDAGTLIVTAPTDRVYESGEHVEIVGQRTNAKEPRFKASTLTVRGKMAPPPPLATDIASLSTDDLVSLVQVEGIVTLTRSGSFTLDDETGTVSISGAPAGAVAKESRVRVVGVVRASGGRVRLTAVSVDSIATSPVVAAETEAPKVAGATTVEEPPAIPVIAGPTVPRFGYILIGAAGALIVVRQWLAVRWAGRRTPGILGSEGM